MRVVRRAPQTPRLGTRSPARPASWLWTLACCAALACGAGDKLSGTLDPNPARCPTLEEIAPNFYRLLREDRFAGLRSVLEQDLGKPLDARDPNGPTRLSALLGVLLEVIREVDVPGFKAVLLDLLRSTENGPFLPQIVGFLRYLDGALGCPMGTSCDHYDLLDKLRLLLTSTVCTEEPARLDAGSVLDLLLRLVRHPRLPELLDLLPRLLRNPTFQGVIDGFRFDNCGQSTCAQEDGFAALLTILLDNVLVSPLPWASIRDLLRQVRLDTPEVLELISLAEDLLTERPPTPERDVLTPLRTAIRCLRIVDSGHTISRHLYRLLSLDEVSLDGLLGGVDEILDADPDRLTLRLVGDVLAYFRTRSLRSFQTVQLVLDVLLAPAQARRLIPSLIALTEAGAVGELADLLIALTDDCTTLPARPQ